MIVKGNLDLSNSSIGKLPDNLIIYGYLKLYKCKNLKELPEGLQVLKSINLISTNLEELPKSFRFPLTGYLQLENTKITKEYITENFQKFINRCKW